MVDDDKAAPTSTSASSPWFSQQPSGTEGLSTTPDDANANLLLNKIADDMGSQNDDVVAQLNAIAAAINAKPSA
jgi:hypothetical protein